MFPGLSPIYLNPSAVQTNVGPIGNDPGWSLAQSPNVTIPNIPAGASTGEDPVEPDPFSPPAPKETWQQRAEKLRNNK